MSPNSDSTALYDRYAIVKCAGIRDAASFAMWYQSEESILTFIQSHVTAVANGTSAKMSALSKISPGQSKAHESLQRDLVPCFYTNYPGHCPLKTDSASTKEEQVMYARAVLKCNQHKTSSYNELAWFKACLMASSKANFAAKSTTLEIIDKRPLADLPPV